MSRQARLDRVIARFRHWIGSRIGRLLWRTLGAFAIGLGAGFGPQIGPPTPRPPSPSEEVAENGDVLDVLEE